MIFVFRIQDSNRTIVEDNIDDSFGNDLEKNGDFPSTGSRYLGSTQYWDSSFPSLLAHLGVDRELPKMKRVPQKRKVLWLFILWSRRRLLYIYGSTKRWFKKMFVRLLCFIRKNHTGKFKGWNKWPKWNNIIDLQIYVWTKYNWKMDSYMYLTRIKTFWGFITRDVLKTYPLSQLRIY